MNSRIIFASNSVISVYFLISVRKRNVIINLRRYKKYSAEVVELLKNADSEYIPADAYEAVNDKLLYRQHEILKFTADHQSSSFSYIDSRKMLEKRGFLKNQLSEDMTRLLNELLDVRNWTFHNPQSLMVAAKEAMEKNIPDALKGIAKVTPQLNPIPVPVVDKYELLLLRWQFIRKSTLSSLDLFFKR